MAQPAQQISKRTPAARGLPVERRYLTEAEMALYTGLSKRTLQGWRLFGKGPGWYKLAGCVRYSIDEVQKWLDGCRVGPGAEKVMT